MLCFRTCQSNSKSCTEEQMTKKSQDTREEEKFGGDFFEGGICPEISRPFSKVVVSGLYGTATRLRQID